MARAVSAPVVALFLALSSSLVPHRALLSQTPQTGSLVGRVTDASGDALPEVQVTVRSPSLQGQRTVLSGVNGDFSVTALPPGAYEAVFAYEGLKTVEREVVVRLGLRSRVDATLVPPTFRETLDVESAVHSSVDSSQTSAQYDAREVDSLPIDRDPIAIASFAPGVSDRSELSGQVSISGSIGYDNLVTLDGVDSTFFIFGNASGPGVFREEVGLFIEEAIEETQVLTGVIPAEYGRFSGGVVNAVTKRGGDRFKGSFRIDMTNPAWQEETPVEKELGIRRESNRNDLYSATLGGYLVRQKLWFFLAGSDTSLSDPSVFSFTGTTRPDDFDNRRYEVRLTGTAGERHSFDATTLQNDSEGVFALFGIDPRTIDEYSIDHDYLALRYTGVLGRNLLAEARFSEHDVLTDIGGVGRDLRDSPFLPLSGGFAVYNAPIFDEADSSLDFEDEILAGIVSTFRSTPRLGSHDLKLGFERFTTTQFGGLSQSSTEFLWIADYLTDASGLPILDAEGRFQPLFSPFGALAINLIPDRDAVLETTTTSLFVQDVWRVGAAWSLSLGLRYEEVDGRATPGVDVAAFDSLVPRLAVTYSPGKSGRYRITAGYGEYIGRANSELFKLISTSRNPSEVDYLYVGPPGVGIDFEPGFDLANYIPIFALFPTANAFFEPGLSVPRSREISLSAALELPGGGSLQVALIDRSLEDVFEDFVEIGNGTTELDSPAGRLTLDNFVYRNTDQARRDYLALQVQGSHRLRDNWSLAGHWTWEIENDGNFVGEDFGNPATQSAIGNYPELRVPERNFPVGALPSHLEHKLRIWTHYQLGLGRAGNLALTVLGRYDSPLTYSHTATVPLSEIQLSRDPGYADPPVNQTIFFGGRGSERFDSVSALDLTARYAVPVGTSAEPWIEVQIRNLFDSSPRRTFDTSIVADLDGPLDQDGIPTRFTRSPTYGRALSPEDFYPGRELLLSLGVRFE